MNRNPMVRTAVFCACAAIAAFGAVRLAANPRRAQQAAEPAPMTVFNLSTAPPNGAVVLIGGKPEQIASNFFKRYTTMPGDWTMDAQGATTPKGDDLTSKLEFGDCYVHAEFQCSVGANGKSIGEGNSGVGMQGRYEIQIYDSYGQKPNPSGAAALYNQKAPLTNPSKKPGEWQTYDIIFRAPRFDAAGQVVEKPRATLFMNGVIAQNNEEFVGPTGIQYGEFKGQAKTGPIVLQGDHSPVHFRNVWVVAL